MAHPQNIDFPNYPFAPPHAYPFPPPSHPATPPFAHPPPFPVPGPPKPLNPPPSPTPTPKPKPPPHQAPPPTPKPSAPPSPSPTPKPSAPPSPTPTPKSPPHQTPPPTPKPSHPPSPIPKPPPHPISPPSPSLKPPPPHPYLPPPPPHIVPTPPAPGHHSTVIIVVFVSLGGVFFLAFLATALFCFMKKRKRRTIKEFDDFKFDERMNVQEEIVRGPHGEQAVLVTLEEDIHAHETKIKDDIVREASHPGLARHHPQSTDVASSTVSTGDHHLQTRASGTT